MGTNVSIRLMLGMCGARHVNNYRHPHDLWYSTSFNCRPRGKDALVAQKVFFLNVKPLS